MNFHADYTRAAREIYTDGLAVGKGALDLRLVQTLRTVAMRLYSDALHNGNAVLRGPDRYYFQIDLESLGLNLGLALIRNAWFRGVSEAILGPEYRIVDLGIDVPGPGARNQPLHRDHKIPERFFGLAPERHELIWLTFNVPLEPWTLQNAPLMYVPGTQFVMWDENTLRPPAADTERYKARAKPLLLEEGDLVARTALMLHYGSAMRGPSFRPTLSIGVGLPGGDPDEPPNLRHVARFTRRAWNRLDPRDRLHFRAELYDKLEPFPPLHQIPEIVEATD